MRMKRSLALLLCAMLTLPLCLAALPKAALAANGRAIQLGADGLEANGKVYFGKYTDNNSLDYDVPWVVLSNGTGSAFLLSKYVLTPDKQFHSNDMAHYPNSNLQTIMGYIYNGFDSREQGAVKNTELSKESMCEVAVGQALPDQKLFPLSRDEANSCSVSLLSAKAIDAPDGPSCEWWLRTSIHGYPYSKAYSINADGAIQNNQLVTQPLYVRPAFNLDTTKVLYTSAAVNGKSFSTSGADSGSGSFTAVTVGAPAEWKLTLLDNGAGSGRENFAASPTTFSNTAGNRMSIDYSGAKTGNTEYLVAMIVNSAREVLYYWQSVSGLQASSGTIDIELPSALPAGRYTLKICNERRTDDYKTDYASAFADIALTLTAAATISDVTVSGATGTAIVPPVEATITLRNDTFNGMGDSNVKGWFTNLPSDISVNISSPRSPSNTITVRFEGTPSDTSTDSMIIQIEQNYLTSNSPLLVAQNPDAKWNIVAPTVTSVTVTPSAANVVKGGTQSFSAAVTGTNGPAQTVTWGVTGRATGTAIDSNGNLTVAAGETAQTLTVTATSTVDTTVCGTATVTVSAPAPESSGSPSRSTQYQIIKGQNGAWMHDGNGLSFTANGDYGKFINVWVDGAFVSGSNYTAYPGSTIIQFKPEYLATLSYGTHTLRVNYTDGYAETVFTVNSALAPDLPKTGDDARPALWLGAALMAAAGMLQKRRRQG